MMVLAPTEERCSRGIVTGVHTTGHLQSLKWIFKQSESHNNNDTKKTQRISISALVTKAEGKPVR